MHWQPASSWAGPRGPSFSKCGRRAELGLRDCAAAPLPQQLSLWVLSRFASLQVIALGIYVQIFFSQLTSSKAGLIPGAGGAGFHSLWPQLPVSQQGRGVQGEFWWAALPTHTCLSCPHSRLNFSRVSSKVRWIVHFTFSF